MRSPPNRTPISATHPLCGFFLIAMAAQSILLAADGASTQPGGSTAASMPALASRDAANAMDAYYLRTCAMCWGLLGARGESIELTHVGRRVRVCSRQCLDEFQRDAKAGIARLDAVMIADQLPYYPLNTSLIDDRPLGAHPLDFIWGNRLFRAVDEGDRDKIITDPESAILKLDHAVIAAQVANYGMPDKCPVQGAILPTDEKIDIVVANRMVRVCCFRCSRIVRDRPQQYLGMVEYANRDAAQTLPANGEDRP